MTDTDLTDSRGSFPRMSPQHLIAASFAHATASFHAGHLEQARMLCEHVLAHQPEHFDALHLLGVVALKQERVSQSILLIEECLRINAQQPAAWLNLGNACLQAGDPAAALEHFDRALKLQPSEPQIWNNRGSALLKLGRAQDALESFEQTLEYAPTHLRAMNNCGKALLDLARPEQALEHLERVLAITPEYPEALCNEGIALLALQRPEPALQSLQRALALRPGLVDALLARGDALMILNRHTEALRSYEQVLQVDATHASAFSSCGVVLLNLNRPEEALPRFMSSLRLRPDHANTLNGCGAALSRLDQQEAALECFERLYALEPDFVYARGNLLNYLQLHCDWQRVAELATEVIAAVQAGHRTTTPFAFLSVADSPRDQLQCARIYSAAQCPATPAPLWTGGSYDHRRLRLAYLSGDFRAHPISYLITGVIEQHDRERFEVYGVSLRAAEDNPIAQRIAAAFDHFIDVSARTDQEVAELLRQLEVDVVIDLMGHTLGSRPGILAHRPAPVQIQYLGLPGTMGSASIDYLIGDECLIPDSRQDCYQEQLILLPHSFQANDNRREIAPITPSRTEAGLPELGFVFCSFNNTYKLTPEFFSIWMRLLQAVPGSVLWLVTDSERTRDNLRREASARGVDPQRLVFAARLPYALHLARLKLADLFLDTLPFNAGTTASDALWAGVPVLTCQGQSFAARMAGSLLTALDLPELIAEDIGGYERCALELATDPQRMASMRARVAERIVTRPLFDTARFTRHLETAFTIVLQRAECGEAPSTCVISRA